MNFVCLKELSAQDLIDFSPVYRCLHIYTVLVSIVDKNCEITLNLDLSVSMFKVASKRVFCYNIDFIHFILINREIEKSLKHTTENKDGNKPASLFNRHPIWYVQENKRLFC